MFGMTPVFSFSFSVDQALNRVIITNSIPSDNQYISDFTLRLAKVTNPSPASTTGPFTVAIGNDQSIQDSRASVTL